MLLPRKDYPGSLWLSILGGGFSDADVPVPLVLTLPLKLSIWSLMAFVSLLKLSVNCEAVSFSWSSVRCDVEARR